MTITTTSQIVHQGPRNLVMHLTGICDGTGEENKVVKINVATLVPRCDEVKIMRIEGNVAYGVVELFWDALVPVKCLELSDNIDFDYTRSGGLGNNAGGGKTGNLLLSTVGFELNSTYSLHLELRKK